ncbi:MAG: amino acid adenylation domain-containing protein [Gemmatimonadota bacterium]
MPFPLFRAVDLRAERAPDHAAVRCAGETLTYGALADRSRRLAHVLRAHGVERGDRVAIHAGKGLAATVGLYGAMRAGAAYVPLDPSAPPQRQAFILRDCGIRHLVTEPGRARALEALLAEDTPVETVVGIDPARADERAPTRIGWADVDGEPAEEALPDVTDDDLAYVLYTSGSTGTPKGVVHTHASALAFARVAARTYGLQPEDRLSNHAPLHFDLSTLDYFGAACAGATTVVVPEPYTKLPASFTSLVEAERLTVLYAVPLALVHMLLHGALDKRDLSSVRWVLFGGEPFPPRHLRALMQALPHARFSNVYGPTEVNGVTYWIVPPLPEGDDTPIPIGQTYDGVVPDLVDEHDRSVPDGVEGELVVDTPTRMRGYWNRPDLDARAFLRRAGPAGERIFYRTGDLVRRRPDGLLDFLGRKDRQIKARGHRVELDEVEAALLSFPAVEAGAVFAVEGDHGSKRIEAALTPTEGFDLTALRTHLASLLPPYALPERIEVLPALPRTSSGKIDRLALAGAARSSRKDAPA